MECLKTWVGIFQVGIFRVEIFQEGVFLIPRLYINLYIKKQHVFLLRHDNLYSSYAFQMKSSLIWKVQIRNFSCFLNYWGIMYELWIEVRAICELRFWYTNKVICLLVCYKRLYKKNKCKHGLTNSQNDPLRTCTRYLKK